MIIKSLELENFRNYETLSIRFDSGTNILYGDNAQAGQIFWKPYFCPLPQNHTRAARTGT